MSTTSWTVDLVDPSFRFAAHVRVVPVRGKKEKRREDSHHMFENIDDLARVAGLDPRKIGPTTECGKFLHVSRKTLSDVLHVDLESTGTMKQGDR